MESNTEGIDTMSQRQCIYCHNFCKFSCPSYIVTKDQKILQTQKNYLIYLSEKGSIRLDREFGKSVYLCNDCRRCEKYCLYSEKNVLHNNRYARSLILQKGLAPKEVYEIEKNLKSLGHIFEENCEQNLRRTKIEQGIRENKNAEDIHLNDTDVYIYIGDYVRYLEPQIFTSFKHILDLIGIKYTYDWDEISDGELALELGMIDLARKLMKSNLERIKKYSFRKMVVLSPESYYALKVEYGQICCDVRGEVVHYTEFLSDYLDEIRINIEQIEDKSRIKYFDPCKLGRFMGVFNAPREILSEIFKIPASNIEFFKNRHESECCGGYITFFDKKVTEGISRKLIEECKESGSNVLITACPLCLHNLKEANFEKKIKIYDLAEYICMYMKK